MCGEPTAVRFDLEIWKGYLSRLYSCGTCSKRATRGRRKRRRACQPACQPAQGTYACCSSAGDLVRGPTPRPQVAAVATQRPPTRLLLQLEGLGQHGVKLAEQEHHHVGEVLGGGAGQHLNGGIWGVLNTWGTAWGCGRVCAGERGCCASAAALCAAQVGRLAGATTELGSAQLRPGSSRLVAAATQAAATAACSRRLAFGVMAYSKPCAAR